MLARLEPKRKSSYRGERQSLSENRDGPVFENGFGALVAV
jgi:hypothetical protein